MNDWFEHITFHTVMQPETPAMVMEDRIVTYRMLGEAITRCAHRIIALNLANDAAIAIVIDNPIRQVVLTLALQRLGRVSISLEPSQFALADMTFAAVLGDATANGVVSVSHRLVAVTDDWFTADPPAGVALPAGFGDGQKICRMSLTSGSTGKPKLISFSSDEVGVRMHGLLQLHWSRMLCLLGLSTAWGYWTACAVLAFGGTLCISASPFQSVRMIELFGIDYVMAAAEQLLALTRAARKTGATMPSLRLVESGGAPPSRALLQSAMTYVCKDVYCRYGASEAGVMARAHARDVLASPDYAGYVLPGVELQIVDAERKAVPAGEAGEIRSRLKLGGDAHTNWVDLGDLGFLSADGALHVLGRASDIALVNSNPIPQVGSQAPRLSIVTEAEHVLRLEWDATDAAAVLLDGTPGLPRIGLGTVDCKDANAQALQAILRARGIDCDVEFFAMRSIPRTVSGKINRAELKSMMLAMGPR